jgi:threonine dehydratase
MFAHIQEAARRLRGQAHVTPLMTCRTLDQRVGAAVFLKCESFQRTGSFKFRGAFNAISQLPAVQKARGVVTFSSGNHAQAVALTARLVGIEATVVMPVDAPVIKRAAAEGYGARVIAYDPRHDDREAIAHRLEVAQGCTLIPPFDHPAVIAGQGTAALELLQSVPPLDMLLVPCGGGGLLSGSAIAAKGLCPACRVVGIEPALADDATRSFHSGRLHSVHNPPTIADGTRTPSLGRLTYPLVQEHVDDMRTVSEEAIMAAVRFLFYRLKLVVEPSGALGVAALLSGVVRPRGRTGVILSGGNIDAATMVRILQPGTAEDESRPAPRGA